MLAPILPLGAVRPIEAWPQPGAAREVLVGELLRLRVSREADGSLLGSDESGLQLRLRAGLATHGETLLLRVLGREPQLSLQLLQRQPAPAAGVAEMVDEWQSAALRPDQAWLERWRQAQSAALPVAVAQQWRARALAAQLRPPEVPFQAPWLGPEAVLAAHAAPLALPGWSAQGLWLRLLSPWPVLWQLSADDENGSGASLSSGPEGLRLSLNLQLGEDWLLILLEWRGGLLLHFSAESTALLARLRGQLPRIVGALSRVPLPLRHCTLGSQAPGLIDASPSQRARGLAQADSQLLFRAAAEIVALLQRG